MTTTEILIVAVALLVGGYTAYRSWQERGDLTVSMTLRAWSQSQLAVPWAGAVLAGHWWGPSVPAWWPDWTPGVLVALTWVVGVVSVGLCQRGVIGFEWEKKPTGIWRVWLGVLIGGYVAGAALWPLTGGA